MKLFKAALILGILLVLASNAFAQTDWAVSSALALPDVSSDTLIYECPLCVKDTMLSQLGAVVYSCDKDTENCELTVSEKRGDAPRNIGTLKFSNAKAYFINKKLLYLQAVKANKNNLPYEINSIKIPYVSSGDKIDFVSASPGMNIHSLPNPSNLVINQNYFKNFYYDVGDYDQISEQLFRNPYAVSESMNTELLSSLRRGYWRPVTLCGREYFDAVNYLDSVNIGERELDVRHWSWFFVAVDENNQNKCVVKNYQLSVKEDPVYKNNVQRYSRQYNCGHTLYNINFADADNFECVADTGEFARNEPGDLLRCPREDANERAACLVDSAVSMQVGSTIYRMAADTIYSDVDSEQGSSEEDIPKALVLNSDSILGEPVVYVSGSDSLAQFHVLSTPCSESPRGCYKMKINSGKKAGLTGNEVSFVELEEAEGVIEIRDADGRNLQRRYVLHNPDGTARYRLAFNDNELVEISNLNKPSVTGTRVEGQVIKGIRMVSNLATLRGTLSRLNFNQQIDLYPLQEGQDEASVNRPYLTYVVRQGGERLYDVAARFNGVSTIQELQSNPSNIGVPVSSENSGPSDLVIEYAREIRLFNRRRNNGEWSQTENTNPALFGGEEIFIPLSAMSYLHPSQRNRVTIHSNPAQSYQSITQRQREGTTLIFRDIGSLDVALNGAPENARYPELQEWNRFLRVAVGNALSGEQQSNEQVNNVDNNETTFLGRRGATEGEVMEIGQLPTERQTITGMQILTASNSIVETRCQEGDGGNNIWSRGIVTVLKIVNGRTQPGFAKSDSCLGNQLTEYYCNSNNRGYSEDFISCSILGGTCRNGACVLVTGKGDAGAKRSTPREQRAERRTNETLNILEADDTLISRLANIRCNNHRVCQQSQRGAYCDITRKNEQGICRPSQWNSDPIYGISNE